MKELKGIDNNTAIHCPTEELAKQVCKILHEAGKEWNTGESYLLDTAYNAAYQENTVYFPMDGMYGNLTHAIEEGCRILPASEFIKLNSPEIPDNSIPEKWCVRRTPENAKVLNAWAYSKTDTNMVIKDNVYLSFGVGWPEITFQQWCILNKSWLEGEGREVWKEYQREQIKGLSSECDLNELVFDLKFVSEEKPESETRKIIGYKAPFDMNQEEENTVSMRVKKGEIFVKDKFGYWNESRAIVLPTEWVEKDWEPVYEEEKYEIQKNIAFMGLKKGTVISLNELILKAEILTKEDIENKTQWFRKI